MRRIVFGECPAPVKTEYFLRGPGKVKSNYSSDKKNKLYYTLYINLYIFLNNAGLVFREAERDLGFALMVSHAAGLPITNSLMMAVQTHILRILLFDVRPARVYQPE